MLPARLSGITVAAEEAFVLRKLFEVLDLRPTFEAAAINVPMGLFDAPLTTSPYHDDCRLELIRERLPGVDDVVPRTPPDGAGGVHMLQAGALLFTARRASGRAISRMPIVPIWDDIGMQMEIVR